MTAEEHYNDLAQQQRTLSASIREATGKILEAMASKEKIATEQKTLQASDIGIPYPQYSVADVRAQVLDEVVRRLEQRDATQRRDWSTRLVTSGGTLEE